MKRIVAAAAVAVGLWAAMVPAENAGACSIYCLPGELGLELVEVRRARSADPRGLEEPEDLPEWPELARLDDYGSLWFPEDSGHLYLVELDAEVE